MLFGANFEAWEKLGALVALAVVVSFCFVFRGEPGTARSDRFRKKHPALARASAVLFLISFVGLVAFVRSR
ncbi:unnamed protein product [Gemmata massiliana]|uniref:Transmembrane protein n=1 Tax=Gemmata massiliana TaxID=1210884 RepID=A0A6P2CTP7_9BACT|nr:hypothetical protein [Gemmata massiliana]VTR91756.1 unnamed protein product [Gemmata massiliana]